MLVAWSYNCMVSEQTAYFMLCINNSNLWQFRTYCMLAGVCLPVSTCTCFLVCENKIKRGTCGHARRGGGIPEYWQSPVLLLCQLDLSLYLPLYLPTMPHPLGNRRMNTITTAASKSCLRGWFSSWFSGKMSGESLHKGKCEVFQVNVNVGTWVWEPMAQRRVGSPESVALTEVPRVQMHREFGTSAMSVTRLTVFGHRG